MESIKCNLCRKTKPSNDFLKNGKTLKSCVTCRDKNKTVKEPVVLPVKDTVPKEPVVLHESNELVNVLLPIIHSIPCVVPKGWKILSGKWIKINSERALHQELTKKMILQFKKRSAFPIHKYLMKYVFVDIRDLYTS